MNKESQDILNYACKKIYKLFKPYYVLSYVFDDEEFNIDLGFTKKSKKLLKKKEVYKRVIAKSIFEELDEKLCIENSEVRNIIEPCVNDFEKFDRTEILTDKLMKLEDDFQVLTKPSEYYDLRTFSFDNLETSRIKNLGLINLFLEILPKQDLEKFKYVVEFTGLKSSRNFRRFEKPIHHKLFPDTYNVFYSALINRFKFYLLMHFRSKVSNYANISDKETFQFSNSYKAVFETDENIRILNHYLASLDKKQPTEYFLNSLLAVIEDTDVFDLKLSKEKLKSFRILISNDIKSHLPKFDHNRSDGPKDKMVSEIKIIKENYKKNRPL